MTFPLGTEAVIYCLSSGLPQAQRAIWYRNGVKLETNAKYKVNRTMLMIHDLTLDDSGPYVCRVGNNYTNTTAVADIKIIGNKR